MKRMMICVMIIVLLFSTSGLATEGKAQEDAHTAISSVNRDFVYPDGKTIEMVIEEAYPESFVNEVIADHAGKLIPVNSWIDTSLYVLEYGATPNFLSELENAPANGITKEMLGGYPNILIPIFGEYDDSSIRIVGHVKIRYIGDGYSGSPVIKNALSEAFISGEVKHFLEEIDAFNGYQCVANSLGLSGVSRPILLRYVRATESDEKLLLVVDGEDVIVFDFMNTAHRSKTDKCLVPSIDQYISDRLKYEEQLATDGGGFREISTAKPTQETGLNRDNFGIWIIWSCTILVGICTIIVLTRFLHARKKKTE